MKLLRVKRFRCIANGLADARCVARPGKDKTMFSIRIAMAVMLAACLVTGAQAAEKAKPAAALKGPAQAEATYDDPLGRSTPQGTVLGFLRAMQREDLRAGRRFPGHPADGKARRAACPRAELHPQRGDVDHYDHAQHQARGEPPGQPARQPRARGHGQDEARGIQDPARARPEGKQPPGLALLLGDPQARAPDLRGNRRPLARAAPAGGDDGKLPCRPTAVPVDHTPRGASPGAFSRLALHEGDSLPWFASRCATASARR